MGDEHTLEFLLAFDGRVHWLEGGHWIKFDIRRVAPSNTRPHGLRYALTLHAPDGTRLMGFDNAHGVRTSSGRTLVADHWHRTEGDQGRPYAFQDAVRGFLSGGPSGARRAGHLGCGDARR